MQVAIKFDSNKFKYWLDVAEQRQIPYAVALTLSKVAWKAKDAIKNEMRIVFDRPTPFTLNSVYATNNLKEGKFKIQGPKAEVGLKDFFKQTYLTAQVYGGHRFAKASEGVLFRSGRLTKGEYIVPSRLMSKDSYGNIAKGQMNKILSGIKAFGEMGFDANATMSRRSRAKGNAKRFALIKPRCGNRPLGIYEREGKSLKPLFFITKEPNYKRRLKFYDIVNRVREQNIQREFSIAFDKAMRTAR